jgi:hypothetical protein
VPLPESALVELIALDVEVLVEDAEAEWLVPTIQTEAPEGPLAPMDADEDPLLPVAAPEP